MGRPKQYPGFDIYAPQKAYFKTEKGKEAVKRYENSEARKQARLEWQRKKRGTIVDKRQWFIDNYGPIETALAFLSPQERASIELYYGLTDNKPLTQDAIGQRLGKSSSAISRINKAAIEKLNALNKNN